MAYRLVETHAHLDEIEDPEQAVAEAKKAGIIAIIAVGSDYESNQKVLALARQYSGFVYPALGLHPWYLEGANLERDLEFMEANIDESVAIGEIGLDYHKRVRARADKDSQKDVLRDIINNGYYISATPAVEYHEEHRRAVKATPLDRLLLETDSPVIYQRGTESEYESRPADILRSLRGAAELTGLDEDRIAEATTANALRLFGI
ncbi:TatD family hydrolase [Chloroflexota bacterium]